MASLDKKCNVDFRFALKVLAAMDGELTEPTDSLVFKHNGELTLGTGANQADQFFHDTRALAAEADETLDLSGALTNSLGVALAATKIKCLVIRNRDTVTTLTIGDAAATQFSSHLGSGTDKIVLGPEGLLILWNPGAAGYAVAPGASDFLKIERGAGTVTDNKYDIIIVTVD